MHSCITLSMERICTVVSRCLWNVYAQLYHVAYGTYMHSCITLSMGRICTVVSRCQAVEI